MATSPASRGRAPAALADEDHVRRGGPRRGLGMRRDHDRLDQPMGAKAQGELGELLRGDRGARLIGIGRHRVERELDRACGGTGKPGFGHRAGLVVRFC